MEYKIAYNIALTIPLLLVIIVYFTGMGIFEYSVMLVIFTLVMGCIPKSYRKKEKQDE